MTTARTVAEDRQTLLERLTGARSSTDSLFSLLAPEALYERPIPERHRLIFYLGHLEAFDWNLLAKPLGLSPFDAKLDQLFAFGIDPTDGGLPNEPPSAWPPEHAVREYGQRVRAELDRALARTELSRLEDGKLHHVAIEHRLMHAETLAYLFHQLDHAHKRRPPAPEVDPPGPAIKPGVANIPEGRATLGLARNGGFGWDNEFEENTVEVPKFAIASTPVSNGQFLAFVRNGGYVTRELWRDDDWAWKEQEKLAHPHDWRPNGKEYDYRGMFGAFPLPLDWPAYVSYAEASAYARWAGGALPTEAQWHRAAYGTPDGQERAYPWGDDPPTARHGNFDFARWDPAPVGSYPAGRSAFGVFDLLGNGWEWTQSPFAPFQGFQAFPFYPGYSANFFDGKHFVMKGGSSRTAACMLRRSFRNWFQPHYSYAYSSFRLVTS